MTGIPDIRIDPEDVRRLVEMGLTDRQAGIFVYLFEHSRRYGFQPSIRELCDEFAIRSLNGVLTHLRALASKGWIEQSHSHSRAVRFLRTPSGGRFCGFVCREE
jgi:SOS-response transcriptional repressor LexA